MPNKGLSIGAGIAAGAQSFVQSFMQARQMKEQEKLQQNAFLVQVLTKQLEDDTIPYFQRAKILDSIPQLIGIKKMDRRLSEMMGMDEVLLNEPAEAATKGKEGTSAQDLVDTSVTDSSMASSIRLKGTQATSDVPASLERKATLRANINTVKRQAFEASQDAFNKAKQATDQWNNVVQPTKNEMQKLLDDGYDTTSQEYRGLQTKLNTEIDRYNDLKRMADDADAKDKSLKDSQREAEDILKEYENGISGNSSTVLDNVKKAVQKVRENNPQINDPSKPNYLTDDAIIQYLRQKGKIK